MTEEQIAREIASWAYQYEGPEELGADAINALAMHLHDTLASAPEQTSELRHLPTTSRDGDSGSGQGKQGGLVGEGNRPGGQAPTYQELLEILKAVTNKLWAVSDDESGIDRDTAYLRARAALARAPEQTGRPGDYYEAQRQLDYRASDYKASSAPDAAQYNQEMVKRLLRLDKEPNEYVGGDLMGYLESETDSPAAPDAAQREARLREALDQVVAVCDDNLSAACNHQMALHFVRDVALAARATEDRQQ